MTIKKLVVGSMFSMLLGSGMAAADWGDVYYCQMTTFNQITIEGEMESYILEKFQFKLDQTKNAMVFGNAGIFTGQAFKLTKDAYFPRLEFWYANDEYSMTFFREGKFLYSANTGSAGIRSVSADCDKF